MLNSGGNHGNSPVSESFYDRMRREWAERFSTVDPVQADDSTSCSGIRSSEETSDTPPSDLSQGWALSKPRVSTRFTPKVKAYLSAKFDLGEKTGLNVDPNQVSADMRNARDEGNNRRFCREEWFTKNQIKSYFSRLASAKRKGQGDVDDRAELEDILGEQEDNSRQLLINSIIEKIGLRHPIDLFSLYVLFPHFRPRDATPENSFFQVSSHARANVCITCEKTKGNFP